MIRGIVFLKVEASWRSVKPLTDRSKLAKLSMSHTAMKTCDVRTGLFTNREDALRRDFAADGKWSVDDENFSVFRVRGKEAINDALSRSTIFEIVRNAEARWHPSGFAVFNIFEHDECSVRLHVWPGDGARKLPWHPLPHSHDKHLVSKIVAGQKYDIRHDVSLSRMSGDNRVYLIRRDPQTLSSDDIVPLDVYSTILRSEERAYGVGEWCAQKAGTFHSIPPDCGAISATICAKSSSTRPDLQRLLGPFVLPFRHAERPDVTPDERARMSYELEACCAPL